MPLIGISASNNKYSNPAKKAAKNYKGYVERGSNLQSLTIIRGDVKGIDNNKAMYPLAGIPIIGYIAHHALDQKEPVKVVGDQTTGEFIEFLNGLWNTGIDFVNEGDRLSLANSMHKLFHKSKHTWNILVMSDVPLVKDYVEHDHTGDIVIPYNAEKLTRNLSIKRNFYTYGDDGNEKQWFKEPNLYYFSQKGLEIAINASNDMYRFRKAGGLFLGLAYHFAKCSKDPGFIRTILHRGNELIPAFYRIYMHKKGLNRTKPIDFGNFSNVIQDLYGINLELTFSHDDIFRMLDMDGLNNDWVMYEHLMRKLFKQGKIHPRLVQLREVMEKEKKRWPVVDRFEGLVMEYIRQVNTYLPQKYQLPYKSIEDMLNQDDLIKAADELADLVPNVSVSAAEYN